MEDIKESTIETAVQESVEQPTPTPQDNLASQNYAMMRKKIEAAENRARQAEERAAAIERERKQQPYNQQQPSTLDDDDIDDPEDIVVNKKLKKITAKWKQEQNENKQTINNMAQELARLRAETTMNSIADFKEVANDENINILKTLYPDDYETVMMNPDPQKRVKVAYNMVKNYGIVQSAPIVRQNELIKAADKKIEANKSKPSVVAAAPISTSPMTKYGRYNEEGRLILTDEDRDRINAETRRKLMQG